ncbi:DUF4446 family protein [Paenibacillus sp. P96]|uniref:DUF4446 family protein n=1 Tax=Paenibacillus zeirhizosphaerae TaxID=2987519 RepID=A0ABT9FP07_9BACL|nr:DUF4446 family protein [Paenibacillus sp. P96]MDP4096454.1 DUF4446 family protein [Paenibacillus sp. P96]
MAELNGLIMEQISLFIAGITFIILMLLIIVMVQGAKLRKIHRKYEVMMSGSGVDDLETLLIDLKVQMDSIEDEQQKNRSMMDAIRNRMNGMKANIGMSRYNAFGERGGELSFSLALLDQESNGMVLTGIYNRDGSYVYAKPVAKGTSSYMLSDEEKEAITLAQQEAQNGSSTL